MLVYILALLLPFKFLKVKYHFSWRFLVNLSLSLEKILLAETVPVYVQCTYDAISNQSWVNGKHWPDPYLTEELFSKIGLPNKTELNV